MRIPWSLLLLWPLAAACAYTPGAVSPAPSPVGAAAEGGPTVEALQAVYTLDLDPTQLSAAISPEPIRVPAENDDLYDLSVGRFFRPAHLTADAVRWDGEDLVVSYTVRHPFAAPADLNGPVSATNRADLGFAGRLVFLADVPGVEGHRFFDESAAGRDQVVAETGLIRNPDGYVQPAGLLDLAGFTANTFPYKLVVDERDGGNRVGHPNGGSPRGNHLADIGWQRVNIGADRDHWTGYGVLHQGQAATGEWRLNSAALAGGPVCYRLALLARYNDPRGGATPAERRGNRLPPPGPDPTRFLYRMPHGALDVQRIAFLGETGGFVAGQASSSPLHFHVEDWDARAQETTQPDLSLEPFGSRVAQGESGLPSLEVSIPGVIGDPSAIDRWDPAATVRDDDTAVGGDPFQDTGVPGDAIFFTKPVAKPAAGDGGPGLYTGMIRAIDVSDALDRSEYWTPLDEDLRPLAANHPRPISYQAFTVELHETAPNTGWAVVYGGEHQDNAQVTVDPAGNTYVAGDFYSTVDFGEGPRTAAGSWDIFLVKLDPAGRYLWDRTWGSPEADFAQSVTTDATGNIYVAGIYSGPIDFGGGTRANRGDWDAYLLKRAPDGSPVWDRTWGAAQGDAAWGVTVTSSNSVTVTGRFEETVDFGGGPRTSAGDSDGFIVQFDLDGAYAWDRAYGGAGSEDGYAVIAVGLDRLYLTGDFTGTVNFGGGNRTSAGAQDMWLLQLDNAGTYQWDATLGTPVFDIATDVAFDPVNIGPVICGATTGTLPGQVSYGGSDAFLARYTTGGALVWTLQYGTPGYDSTDSLTFDPAGSMYACGDWNITAAFLHKRDPGGAIIWSTLWPATTLMGAIDVVLDPAGDVRVSGHYQGTVDFDPGPGIFQRTSAGLTDAFALKVLGPTGLW
ncbi:MAG TPA: hypothetical protein VEI97_00325 [bacterium]|nr:hypothetical protein [bacterium]